MIFFSCKKEERHESIKRDLRLKVTNLDVTVRADAGYSVYDHHSVNGNEYFDFSIATLQKGQSKYYNIPEDATGVYVNLTNVNPLPTSNKEREEFKVNFTITDYDGTIYYDATEASRANLELRGNLLFITPNSELFWSEGIERYR